MNAPSPFIASLHVALGGAIGSVLRYQTGRMMTYWLGPKVMTAFPWATLTVNIVGSLLMGMLAGWLARQGQGGEPWRLFVGVGVLGGFTTFSAFSHDAVMLWQRGATGVAATYVAGSVMLSILALLAGLLLVRLAT